MSKPKLIIGGRQTGKSFKAREWLLQKTHGKDLNGLLFTRGYADAKRQFNELVEHLETQKVRWSSLDVVFGDGNRVSVRPPGQVQRGVRLEAVASDPISPVGLEQAWMAEHSLHTIDSTEWDVEMLENPA